MEKGSLAQIAATSSKAEGGGENHAGKQVNVTAAAERDRIKRLPTCPDGATVEYTNQGPCQRRARRNKHRRKTAFRIPLKKEDGNLEAQIVEYNCEFPNRVSVRLEYLMSSTKVRLNDRHYMDDLYMKLLEDERRNLDKANRFRERMEQSRMKKLIIDGYMHEIPQELSYLQRHPVVRVNRMLDRLNSFDVMLANIEEEGDEITPVEPYEYDGNMFFKNLHDEGTIWVPSCQILQNETKLKGKVYRAKLRLLRKRKETEAEEKILRILSNLGTPTEGEDDDKRMSTRPSRNPSKSKAIKIDVTEEEGSSSRPSRTASKTQDKSTKKKRSKGSNKSLQRVFPKDMLILGESSMSVVDRMTSKMDNNTRKSAKTPQQIEVEAIQQAFREEVNKIQELIKKSKEEELEGEANLDVKRREQEILFTDTVNYEYTRIMSEYEARQRERNLEDILKDREELFPPEVATVAEDVKLHKGKSRKQMKPYRTVFKQRDSGADTSTYAAEPTFKRLKHAYEIRGSYPFQRFEPYQAQILKHVDDSKDAAGVEFMDHGFEVVDAFLREELTADEHVKKNVLKGFKRGVGEEKATE